MSMGNVAELVLAFGNRQKMMVQIHPFPQLRDWHRNSLDRLPGLKWMRTLWVATVTIGNITPPDLKEAHKKFKISSEEFDEVASVLEDTLTELKIPAKEKAEVMGAFTGHKSHVVTP